MTSPDAPRARASVRPLLLLLLVSALLLPARAECAIARAITVGGWHACALTSTGGVKCWGANERGQLGDGTTTARPTPTDVSGLTSGVVALSAGRVHTCALTSGGGVKCWGLNAAGQLGDGTATDRWTPVDVQGLTAGLTAVAAGGSHTCALTAAGGVKCWGDDYDGQLGDGTTLTNRLTPVDVSGLAAGVTAISAGGAHSCALTSDGSVRCWGSNSVAQLGDGPTADRPTPVQVAALAGGFAAVEAGDSHTCALTVAGGVKCWGEDSYGALGDGGATGGTSPVDVSGLTSGVSRVSAGDYYACAVTTSGGARCWGYNADGQLGDASTTWRGTPVNVSGLVGTVAAIAVGVSHTCAMTTGGGVWCWGRNAEGQVGNGTATTWATPVDVTGLSAGAVQVDAGTGHSCALTAGGAVKCWGYNIAGELGDGTTTLRRTPVDVQGLGSATAVTTGAAHTCALTSGGGVRCWGSNGAGQLGDGTATDRYTPVDVTGLTGGAAAVSAGNGHTCALTSGGGVKCWGDNDWGQLGDGTTTWRLTPVNVSGLATGVAALSAGVFHTCALTTGGGVKCWGQNGAGQLGDGTTAQRSTPVDVLGLASGVAAVAAGGGHTCVVTTEGGVKCWGQNGAGQLGDGTTIDHDTPAAVPGLTDVAAIVAANQSTCALTNGGGVKCWGHNATGLLGDGSLTDRPTPVDVLGLTSGVAAVGAGAAHTCALTTGGGVKCWGDGTGGQLGNPAYGPQWTRVRTVGFGQSDFDADGKADLAVYRPSSGTWFSLDSSSGNTTDRNRGWGVQAQNDTPVVGDFDGDGINDPTVFRPASGTWFVLKSGEGFTTWEWFGWGVATDRLVPGDYDGDGMTDAAVYRASEGKWYVRPSSGATAWNVGFGNATDTPVAGDFDGDGKRDIAVYRASTGTWFWLKSSAGFATYDYRGWGVDSEGDTPAPGDYDGDGKTDLCVFRPASGTWFVLKSASGYTAWEYLGWGASGDTVVPSDYDGDGKTDAAVYRAATGTWYVRPSSGATQWSKLFGSVEDLPLVTIR